MEAFPAGAASESRAHVLARIAGEASAQPTAEALYVEATQGFVDLVNSFLEELANMGDPMLSSWPSR